MSIIHPVFVENPPLLFCRFTKGHKKKPRKSCGFFSWNFIDQSVWPLTWAQWPGAVGEIGKVLLGVITALISDIGLIEAMVTFPTTNNKSPWKLGRNPQQRKGLCLPVRNQFSGANLLSCREGTVTWLNLLSGWTECFVGKMSKSGTFISWSVSWLSGCRCWKIHGFLFSKCIKIGFQIWLFAATYVS